MQKKQQSLNVLIVVFYTYSNESSYIKSVKWADFISNKDYYLNKAIEIRDNRKSYKITKEIS